MKDYFILINWILSFMALSIDTEESSLMAVMIVFAWFATSSIILIRAQRSGTLRKIEKRFKIDEL